MTGIHPGHLLLAALALAVVDGCGGKTGLTVPEFDATVGFDARPDVMDSNVMDDVLDSAVPDTMTPDALLVDTMPDVMPDTMPDAMPDTTPDAMPDAIAPDSGEECVPFRSRAELASLDIFLLIDSSGSMDTVLATGGETKRDALYGAIEGFLSAPESDGLAAALTFFPIEDESVDRYCSTDRDCRSEAGGGEEGDCYFPNVCTGIDRRRICRTNADCPDPGSRCYDYGRCEGRTDFFCEYREGFECEPGLACIDLGICQNRTSCDIGEYRRPAVRLGLLPDNGPRLIEALATRDTRGGTPTLPALTGVHERAQRRSRESPGSKVIVLLATDGVPAACDDNLGDPYEPEPDRMLGIPAPAAIAEAGARNGVETFVVGVFDESEEELARENLSALARAGGTDEALIVTTDFDVSGRLLEVFNDVRESVQTCVYAIPAAGAVPDPRDLNVQLVERGGSERPISRVESAEDCRGDGYFFEGDLTPGDRPGYVELCPTSCDFAERANVFVQMQSDCET